MGFRHYGFVKEAAMIARDISEAASYFTAFLSSMPASKGN